MVSTLGIIQLAKMVHNLFLTLKKVINRTTSSQKAQQTSLNSVSRAVMDNHITFDFLLTNQGEFYAIANTPCMPIYKINKTAGEEGKSLVALTNYHFVSDNC